MAYRCNPCRHTSAPFPIARSEWDMKQNNYFCPDCSGDYTLSTNKYPIHKTPKGNCFCGCKPCCCRETCNISHVKHHIQPPACFPPHPAVVPIVHPLIHPIHHPVVPVTHPVVPTHHPVVPTHHPVVPPTHPVVPVTHPVVPPTHPVVPVTHPVVPSTTVKSSFWF
jgi:hypothetical protein